MAFEKLKNKLQILESKLEEKKLKAERIKEKREKEENLLKKTKENPLLFIISWTIRELFFGLFIHYHLKKSF